MPPAGGRSYRRYRRRAGGEAPPARADHSNRDPSFAHRGREHLDPDDPTTPRGAREHERRGSSVTKTIRIAALPGAPRHQDGAPKVELASAIYIASQRRRNDDQYTAAATTIHESALSQSAQSHQARVSLTPRGLVVGYRIAGTAVPRPAACQVATALHKAGLCRRFPNVCSHRAFKRHRGARLHQYDFALLAAPVVVPPQPSSSSTAGGAGGAAAHVGYSQVLLCDGAGACCQAPQAR